MFKRIVELVLAMTVTGLISPIAHAQSSTIFSGIPSVKISEGGVERSAENLPREKSLDLGCVISEIAGKYYWATRENKELVRQISGAFVTYVAVDGSGYVRILAPGMKGSFSPMGGTETKFDYVEHLLIGLRSITYYGTRGR